MPKFLNFSVGLVFSVYTIDNIFSNVFAVNAYINGNKAEVYGYASLERETKTRWLRQGDRREFPSIAYR